MKNRKRLTRICEIGGILLFLPLWSASQFPTLLEAIGARLWEIVNNLRQIDGAMQEWAIQHGQTGTVLVSEENVIPYLGRRLKPVAGERYVLKTLAESPQTSFVRGYSVNLKTPGPEASRIRLIEILRLSFDK